MKLAVRPWLKVALMLLFILAVYYQAINHPFSLFDDPSIVDHYGLNSTLSFLDVITPGRGFYYRPLVDLSYWLDFQLWGMDPTFMHLENIVTHLINVFFVFLIASRLSLASDAEFLPYACALLFGLHPINSESVNWIAGRTDVFAGLFVFIAVYCLIRAIQVQSTKLAMLAFGFTFVGTLAKETAVMLLPVALIIILYWPVVPQDVSQYKTWRTRFLIIPTCILSGLVIALLLFVYSKGHGDNAVSLIFKSNTNVLMRSFQAFGFYVKKLFLPHPLNVAIVEVSPLYAIAGIIAACIFVFTYRRAGIRWILFACSALFIIPALLVAATPMAWTPFGERYLYIPSAFAVIASVDACYRYFVQRNAVRWIVPLAIVFIGLSSIVTFQRGMLWRDNLALLEDIIAKSPNFGVARNEYAGLLNKEGRYAEAVQQLNIALQQQNKASLNRIMRLNLIWLKIKGKPLAEARLILLSEIAGKADADVELLMKLNRIDESLLSNARTIKDKRRLAADIIDTNEILFLRTGDPFYIYRSGQILLSIDNKQLAAAYFRKAYNESGLKDYYRESARRLAEKLDTK